MKRKIAFILVLISLTQLLFCACKNKITNEQDKSSVQKNDENATYLLLSHEVVNPDGTTGKTTYLYDKNHNYIGSEIVYANGNHGEGGTSYLYDDQSNLIEKTHIFCYADGIQHLRKESYATDNNGYTTLTTTIDGILEHQILYDIDGSRLEETSYSNGSISQSYIYDENEKLISKQIDNEIYTYDYDTNGMLVKEHYIVDGSEVETTIHSYNEKGQKIETTYYNSKGEKKGYWEVFIYDKRGDLVKEEHYSYYGEKVSYNEYVYDNNHNLTSNIYYYDGEAVHHHTYTYDSDNRELSYSFISFGEIVEQQKCIYDKNGNQMFTEFYDRISESFTYNDYQFDENGNLVETINYNDSHNENYRITYIYDKSGNKTEEKKTNSDDEVEYYYQWQYDNNGNTIRYVAYTVGSKEYTNQYTYDDNNNLIEDIRFDLNGNELYRHYYTYERIQTTPQDAARIQKQQEELLK